MNKLNASPFSERHQTKIAWEGEKVSQNTQTNNTQTDFVTARPTRPRGPSWLKYLWLLKPLKRERVIIVIAKHKSRTTIRDKTKLYP